MVFRTHDQRCLERDPYPLGPCLVQDLVWAPGVRLWDVPMGEPESWGVGRALLRGGNCRLRGEGVSLCRSERVSEGMRE